MNRTLSWLAVLICAGWISSSVHAWHPFAGRRGACADCSTGAVVDGGAGCRTGALGGLAGISGKVVSAKHAINQWILNVPQKTPPPPKPLAINPYTRSPRDYFMVGDP